MKKIGIDVTSAITQGGGIGRYTRELLQALLTHDSTTQYQLFTAKLPNAAQKLPQAANATHCSAPFGEEWLYRLWYRAKMPVPVQWFTGKIDLFHSPDFVLPPVSGKIPTVLTVHDLSFIHYPHAYLPALVNYLNRIVPWSVQRATHVLADSLATKNDLKALWNVPDEKITVLYSAVGEQFQPVSQDKKQNAMRQKYKLGNTPYLLSVGTIQPRKNYQHLIRAFAPIARNWPHNLVIAGGKGWLYEEILQEIKAQQLEGRVEFIGYVDDADLPALYSAATLFLMPSLYEGFGIPILEAMACGVPVIASDTSSLPEVVGSAGVLLPPTDVQAWTNGIHQLLLNAPRRGQLVGQGALQAHRFSWQKTAEQLHTLYADLLNH